MNKLVITQDNSRTEYPVPNAVVTALYNIGKDDDQNQSLTEGVDTTNNNRPVSTVSGSIRVATAYAHHLQYIAVKYPNLSITADSTYIYFTDPEVERVLLAAGIGDGVGISISAAANATIGTALRGNTTITSFNEFGYFSKANNSPANEMFKGCTNLESIDLSNTTSISTYQFSQTAITDINAPDLVSYTGYNQFAQCTQLETVSSLGHISTIPNSCFFGSYNLETVNLPDECVSIEQSSFFPGDNNSGSLTEVNGIDHVLSFGYRALCRQSNLHLYSQDLYNATSIGGRAFWYVKVHSIDCPNLVSLGGNAFSENPVLTNVDCLGKISSIPEHCFNTNTALQTVKIPYECVSIGTSAFSGCSSLTSITQYNKSLDDYAEGESPTFTNISRITSFNNNCFYNCKLLSLTASDLSSAVSIGNSAFYRCSAISINTLDLSSVSTIGESAFREGPHIDNVIWSNSQTTLPLGVFGSAVLKSITNIDHVTKIYGRALQACQLNHVLYLKNVDKTDYGQSDGSGESGNVFCGDNENATVPALYMPKTIDIFGGYYVNNTYAVCFFGSRGTATIPVVYFKDLEEVYPGSFGSLVCTSLVINNTTPPVWYNTRKEASPGDTYHSKAVVFPDDNQCNITNIYVPDSALSTYLSDPDWSSITDSSRKHPVTFLGMSNLTHYATEADWIAAGKPVDGIIDAYMN